MAGDGTLRVAMAVSVAGMVLLPVFGLLFYFQPKFMHGLHVNHKHAAINCFIAGGCYFVAFVITTIVLCLRVRSRRRALGANTSGDPQAANKMYALPFPEHESDHFAKAMKAMDESHARETVLTQHDGEEVDGVF
ncbi:TPA: hypothetical protein N0F65_003403 [Lagenidium giganteum]|uniref:Uncharacterized protein n=1 Tax=Lagenidium giganteum TaxID=4803 RepID=A0AAV2YTH1_9STRA|nr:TPA: hypothetical protein N0F65_003403 [Lagenidium giganteum]